IAALTVHGTVKLFSKDTLEEAAHLINCKDGRWVFAENNPHYAEPIDRDFCGTKKYRKSPLATGSCAANR
ncbi:MAG: hypothetical protein LBT87_10540, partial [Treponema sp.]|nr:hypothetical protein [Treponema sp.]